MEPKALHKLPLLAVLVVSLMGMNLYYSALAADTDDDQRLRVLVTPPLFVEGAALSGIKCIALNLHPIAVEVDIRVFNAAGERTCGAGPRRLDPGQAESQDCNSDIRGDPNPIRYCVFTYKGHKRLVLGTAQAIVETPDGATTPIGVTVPAQFVGTNN